MLNPAPELREALLDEADGGSAPKLVFVRVVLSRGSASARAQRNSQVSYSLLNTQGVMACVESINILGDHELFSPLFERAQACLNTC